MPSIDILAPWIAAPIVFALLAYAVIRFPREVDEYAHFRKSEETTERIAFFRKWLREGFIIYTLIPLVVLFVIGRLDAFSSLPPEFVPVRDWLNLGDAPAVDDGKETSVPYVLGIVVGIGLAILLGLALRKIIAFSESRQNNIFPDIKPLLPRNGRERFPVMVLALNASFGEELFFRVLLPLTLIMVGVPPVLALILAIIVFGLVHLYQGWMGVILTALVGVLLTYAYLRSGSIWVPVAAHLLININGLFIRPILSRLFSAR